MSTQIYDFIGIGLGPFNLGLACLSQPFTQLKALFLDEKAQFCWHQGMMLEGSTLQTPFMSDLVTMADPTSRYSFLNYLKQCDRLYQFYILEDFNPSRIEYNDYCRWAASQLSNIAFGERVEAVHYSTDEQTYHVETHIISSGETGHYQTKRLVLGGGTRPMVPKDCEHLAATASHTADYLKHKQSMQQTGSITLIGSGQSAAEVFYDLLCGMESHNYQLNWLTRSPLFFPLDCSKLTLEMTSPDYIDYFYYLVANTRDTLLAHQKPLFKGINHSLLVQIYRRLYAMSLDAPAKVRLITNSELVSGKYQAEQQYYNLRFHHLEQNQHFSLQSDALIFGTGYHYIEPEFLRPVRQRIAYRSCGRYDVSRDYAIDHNRREIFVQNAELHSHGFTAQDLGMGCYRNTRILEQILGFAPYRTEKSIAFQEFGMPSNT